MSGIINIAVAAARRAGRVATRAMEQFGDSHINRLDFCREIELSIYQEIDETISKANPSHIIVKHGEPLPQESAEPIWLISAISGFTNYLNDYHHFAISIAVLYKQKIHHAVIYDPIRQEMFTANLGSGAYLNNRRIRVYESKTRSDHILIGINTLDIPIRPATSMEFRYGGSIALDLAYVAAGRLAACWLTSTSIQDNAAGILFVKEAGGLTNDMEDSYLKNNILFAAPPKIFKIFWPSLQK